MSVKFICDICKKEIKLHANDCPDMMVITVEGKEYVRIGSKNKLKNTKGILHIHESECHEKFLSIFKRKEI